MFEQKRRKSKYCTQNPQKESKSYSFCRSAEFLDKIYWISETSKECNKKLCINFPLILLIDWVPIFFQFISFFPLIKFTSIPELVVVLADFLCLFMRKMGKILHSGNKPVIFLSLFLCDLFFAIKNKLKQICR